MTEDATTLPPAPPAPAAPALAQPGEDRVLAAVAYLLTILTGIIVFVVAKDAYAKWHAIQAIGLGVAILILDALLSLAGGPGTGLAGLLTLIVILFMAYKAYNGEKVRLPVIAEFADKNA